MNLIVLKTTDPYLNLAIEEYLFRKSKEEWFILWQNDNTVVIGKNQNAFAEVNTEYADGCGVKIARRITGGGAVYHDLGNVNYSFIKNKNNREIDFTEYTSPVLEVLSELGVEAELSGRNDLVTLDGKKFSGSAQYSDGERVLHHGTLLFDSDLDMLSRVLRVDPEKLHARAISSVRSRVTNLKPLLSVEADASLFIDLIASRVTARLNATRVDAVINSEIINIAKRNASREWLYPERDYLSRYSYKLKKRYGFGGVELYLDMKNGIITAARIFGDFFALSDISEIEALAEGRTVAEFRSLISEVRIGDYISGMNNSDFSELLDFSE